MYQITCNGKNVGAPCATKDAAREAIKAEWRKKLARGGGGVSAATKWDVVQTKPAPAPAKSSSKSSASK